METIAEIIKYTLPSLIVFITAYYLLKIFFENEAKRQKSELRLRNQKLITPVRLQAYERAILFLERINPDSLIIRIMETPMTARQLQAAMLKTIRAEYEHNLSQQLYISHQAWEVVKNAKENMVKLVNTASARVQPESPALELSKLILDMYMNVEKTPIATAIEFIKQDVQQFF